MEPTTIQKPQPHPKDRSQYFKDRYAAKKAKRAARLAYMRDSTRSRRTRTELAALLFDVKALIAQELGLEHLLSAHVRCLTVSLFRSQALAADEETDPGYHNDAATKAHR